MRFSGHETFVVRTNWPKKGYDFISGGGNFNDENAVVELGVGKNMVSSIHFWMKALGIIEENTNNPSAFAQLILDDNGYDPYIENIGTIWLLHYYLIKTGYASIYSIVFNEIRKERTVFTKRQLASYIRRKFHDNQLSSFNQNTVEKDISVFLRLYNQVDFQSISKDYEDEFASLMLELGLITSSIEEEVQEGTNKREKTEWFYLNGDIRETLPPEIVLFAICDAFEGDYNLSFKRLEIEQNGPGMIFLLNKEGLYTKLKKIEASFPDIIVSETAGNIVLVLPEGINKWDILRQYYEL